MSVRSLEELQKRYADLGRRAKRPSAAPRGGTNPNGRRKGEKPHDSARTLRRLLGILAPYRFHMITVFLLMILHTISVVAAGYLLRDVINTVTVGADPHKSLILRWFMPAAVEAGVLTPEQRLEGLGLIVTILAGLYAAGIILSYTQARIMMVVSQNTAESLRKSLFAHMQKLPLRYFDTHTTGELMSRFTNDVDAVDAMIVNTSVNLFSGIFMIIGTLAMMLYTNVLLTVIILLFIPLFLLTGSWIARRSERYFRENQTALGAVNGYMEETVTGARVVKVFNHEDECLDEFNLLNQDMRDKHFRAQFYGSIMGPVLGNMGYVCFAVIAGVGGLLCLHAHLDVGGLAVFCGYSRRFSMPINQIAMQMSTIFSALAGAERVFAVMDEPGEADDRPDAIGMESMEEHTGTGHAVAGHVVADHVTFGYKPGEPVLHQVSFYAEPGQKIAFVGSTGAGKTTITNLLNRFYDITDGTITIDHVDIRAYKREDLRSHIAMVLQDTHLFTGTVRENIRYGRLDADDEEVVAAAKAAQADGFIRQLENGYDTVIAGDGGSLSQGQCQLLNIARAIISKAPILVLDEATSSVDTATERSIEIALSNLMANRTTFLIAHRLSTVRNATAILVLENGRIIERGNHEQLLALHGRYYELYTGQRELS